MANKFFSKAVKITNIKQQQRRTDRYSIYIDNKYFFSLSGEELINSGLKTGTELTELDMSMLKSRAVLDKAYDRALNLISHRSRSEGELRDYLKRHKYDSNTIDQTLNRLRKFGYINDADFARRWVENRRLLKPTSKRKLSLELRQKYISDEIIRQTLEDDSADELEILRKLIINKRRQTKYQNDVKLMQYLSRQGFAYDDIKSVLSDLSG